jgi:hypothetical protein
VLRTLSLGQVNLLTRSTRNHFSRARQIEAMEHMDAKQEEIALVRTRTLWQLRGTPFDNGYGRARVELGLAQVYGEMDAARTNGAQAPQGSDEWKRYRECLCTASTAADSVPIEEGTLKCMGKGGMRSVLRNIALGNEFQGNVATRHGQAWEPIALEMYVRDAAYGLWGPKHSANGIRLERPNLLALPDCPLAASPDATAYDAVTGELLGVVEVKAPYSRMGYDDEPAFEPPHSSWDEEIVEHIPPNYWVQMQVQMMVTGASMAHFVVLTFWEIPPHGGTGTMVGAESVNYDIVDKIHWTIKPHVKEGYIVEPRISIQQVRFDPDFCDYMRAHVTNFWRAQVLPMLVLKRAGLLAPPEYKHVGLSYEQRCFGLSRKCDLDRIPRELDWGTLLGEGSMISEREHCLEPPWLAGPNVGKKPWQQWGAGSKQNKGPSNASLAEAVGAGPAEPLPVSAKKPVLLGSNVYPALAKISNVALADALGLPESPSGKRRNPSLSCPKCDCMCGGRDDCGHCESLGHHTGNARWHH